MPYAANDSCSINVTFAPQVVAAPMVPSCSRRSTVDLQDRNYKPPKTSLANSFTSANLHFSHSGKLVTDEHQQFSTKVPMTRRGSLSHELKVPNHYGLVF
jgi:hypothetical protein